MKSALLAFVLILGASASAAEPLSQEVCALDGVGEGSSTRVTAVLETDTMHGMFLVSSECDFRIKVGALPKVPESSVVEFLRYVSSPIDLSWRSYEVDVSGEVVLDESRNPRFLFSEFHSYRKLEE